MPGVFVREGYLESKRVAKLASNPLAERFYFHLLLVVREDGTFESDPVLLKNRCFPALEDVTAEDVTRWITDCVSADLIAIRTREDGMSLVEVLRHNQSSKPKTVRQFSDDSESVYPFASFWETYGKKMEKKKCQRKYADLSELERKVIKEKLPLYVASTPDLQFRKYPSTWLENRCWEDEVVEQTLFGTEITPTMRKRKGF